MIKYNCSDADGQEWAAAEVNPGNTVFFLKWNGSAWDAMTTEDVCGTASAGVPTDLLTYCPTPTPSPSDSTAAASCTSDSLLAALPAGSEMLKYNCANIGSQEWAAVKVNPGATVFFLRVKGNAWAVMTADEVCGTASAGLPDELLAYCSK